MHGCSPLIGGLNGSLGLRSQSGLSVGEAGTPRRSGLPPHPPSPAASPSHHSRAQLPPHSGPHQQPPSDMQAYMHLMNCASGILCRIHSLFITSFYQCPYWCVSPVRNSPDLPWERWADWACGTQVDAHDEKPFGMDTLQQQAQDQSQSGQQQMPALPQNAPLTFTMVMPGSMAAQVRNFNNTFHNASLQRFPVWVS